MNSSFQPYDIITSYYSDFKGDMKTDFNNCKEAGLFLVITINNDNTLIGCKITSDEYNGNTNINYTLMIDSHPFLKTDSYIQVDKLHTLAFSNCRKVGEMSIQCRRGFISQMNNYLMQIRNDLEYNAPAYKSPNERYIKPRNRRVVHSKYSRYNRY